MMTENIRTLIKREEITALAREMEQDSVEAEAFFKEMLNQGKGYPDVLFPFSILLHCSGRKDESRKYMTELIKINDHYDKYLSARNHMETGDCHAPDKSSYPAIQFLSLSEQAEKLESVMEESFFKGALAGEYYLILGRIAQTESRWRKAFLYFFAAFFASAKKAEVLLALGQLCYAQGELTLAGEALREGLSTQPEHEKIGLELSYVESELGHFDRARELLHEVYERHPDWPDVAYRLAEYYFSENDIGKALDYCDKALSVNSRYFSANMLKFRLLMLKDDTSVVETFIDGIIDPSLAGTFRIFHSMKKKDPVEDVFALLEKEPGLKQEMMEGLWDDVVRTVSPNYLKTLIRFLQDKKSISEKEALDALERYIR
ncbi:MAG TPA: tetratricopeptide repeat protein [Candidatus Mcinerneyibacteriales bacterium]|nr:tetratricopeptide repeat protein [Candidatus Mcinerneyibacteriales bacterium]